MQEIFIKIHKKVTKSLQVSKLHTLKLVILPNTGKFIPFFGKNSVGDPCKAVSDRIYHAMFCFLIPNIILKIPLKNLGLLNKITFIFFPPDIY